MLQNDYLLAKISVDTAENEPLSLEENSILYSFASLAISRTEVYDRYPDAKVGRIRMNVPTVRCAAVQRSFLLGRVQRSVIVMRKKP